MAELRPTGWTEELLVNAARAFDYPPTPDLVSSVRVRLAASPPPMTAPLRAPRWAPAAGLALGVFAFAFLVTMIASSGARDAVADFLGLSVEGEEITLLPTPRPGETPTPFPTPRPIETYATPVPADALLMRAGFEPVLPPGQGTPSATYIAEFAGVPIVILQYARFDLWQVRLETENFGKGVGIFEKGVFGKSTPAFEELTVNSRPAYWIANGSHIVRFIDRNGAVVTGSERTVDRNTLVWRSPNGMNYRLETDLSREEALAIASGLP